MESIVCHTTGALDDLSMETGPTPEPQPHQVVVEVGACGVNFVDALFVRGTYQIKPPTPFVPGSEIAGTVAAVGDAVSDVDVGDRVMANVGLGGFASHVLATPGQLTPIPPAVSLTRAATLAQSYCTAWFALAERAALRPDERLVVLGAGGGVGAAACDVGRALGATVIGVASTKEKRDLAARMGAAHVIDSSSEDVKGRARELGDGAVDMVLDPVGGPLATAMLRALGDDGRFVVVGFASGTIPDLPANQILLRNRRVVGVDWGFWAMQHPEAQATLLGTVLERVAAGDLHPPEPTTHPLRAAARVLADLEQRRVTGKVALLPSP